MQGTEGAGIEEQDRLLKEGKAVRKSNFSAINAATEQCLGGFLEKMLLQLGLFLNVNI